VSKNTNKRAFWGYYVLSYFLSAIIIWINLYYSPDSTSGGESESARWIKFGNTLIAMFYTIVIPLLLNTVIFGILALFKSYRHKTKILLTAVLLCIVISFLFSFHKFEPKVETPKEREKILEQRREEVAKEANSFLSETSIYKPDFKTVNQDTSSLIKNLKLLTLVKDTLAKKNQNHKLKVEQLNRFTEMNFDTITSDKLEYYRNSIRVEFISYNQDLSKFLAVITYREKHQNDNFNFDGLRIICEKSETYTRCYPRVRNGGSAFSRESYKNRELSYLKRTLKIQNVSDIWGIRLLSTEVEIKDGDKYLIYQTTGGTGLSEQHIYNKPNTYLEYSIN